MGNINGWILCNGRKSAATRDEFRGFCPSANAVSCVDKGLAGGHSPKPRTSKRKRTGTAGDDGGDAGFVHGGVGRADRPEPQGMGKKPPDRPRASIDGARETRQIRWAFSHSPASCKVGLHCLYATNEACYNTSVLVLRPENRQPRQRIRVRETSPRQEGAMLYIFLDSGGKP